MHGGKKCTVVVLMHDEGKSGACKRVSLSIVTGGQSYVHLLRT